jgi:hypothetical protein
MAKPALEAVIVSVDVLDMPRAVDADGGGQMGDVRLSGFLLPRSADDYCPTIGAENGIKRKARLQGGHDMGGVIDNRQRE